MPRSQSARGELAPVVEVMVCHEPDLQRMAQALLIVLQRRGKFRQDKSPEGTEDDQKWIQTTRDPSGS
jgi:hypothetical protein